MAALEKRQGERDGDGKGTAIVFVDLDGFKDVNDTYGHDTGDTLIKLVSGALARLLPEGALLARLGGDEFAVLISSTVPESAALGFAGDRA